LFMDSGLGREAFTIISQGKVEEILSSKEEDRRVIFEEAAGVLKYKQRKQKAEFKLAETEENLFRVDDIIHEIEQQIDPLREQANIAKKYLDKRDQLKEHEISLLVTEIEQLHNEWENALKEIEEEKEEALQQRTEINKLNAKIEVTRNDIQKLDQELDSSQENLLTTTQELEQYEGRKNVIQERSKHFLKNKANLEEEQEGLSNRIESLTKQYDEHKEKLTELQRERQNTVRRRNDLKEKLSTEVETILEKIEDLKAEYIELLNEQAAKRNALQTTNNQIQQLEGKKEVEDEKYSSLKQEVDEVEKQHNQSAEELSTHQKNYEFEKAELESTKTRLD